MSDSDIYKNREALPFGNKSPKKPRRRRKESRRAFDDHERKRRSKNSGLRRMLHLARKKDNEKYFWGSIGTVFIVVLVVIAVWQFVIMEHLVRTQEKKDDYLQYQPSIPEKASPESGMPDSVPE